jgi:predicted ribosomally synthesized peptide with nif11-like leader
MAQQDVLRLFQAAKTNPELRKELNRAPSPESFVQMAEQRGYHFTVEEWQNATRFGVEELKCKMSEIPGI